MIWIWIDVAFIVFLLAVALRDVFQKKHTILRNFPLLGHCRYWMESIGPELRQYIVAGNTEEKPFSRDQRRWVYASSKKENDYFGFGTDKEMEQSANYVIIKHSAFPLTEALPGEANYDATYQIPCAKILGGHRGRRKAFRPKSIVNISGMSYGSLSGPAVEALNRGAKIANCLQATGEGGLSRYHQCGGDLIWQIGTGYFGCRDEQGRFSLPRFLEVIAKNPVQAVEIKLSQGAKPGLGGVLPASKVTREIAEIRGVPMGKDCVSPAGHSAFHDADSLLDFVEKLADATGLPVGIKSAVGHLSFWTDLAKQMATTQRGVDFITIDGGEGGTGASPLVFTDHVALPYKMAMSRVYSVFARAGLKDKVVFIGSGKLGFPEAALLAFSLGADMVNVGREALFAAGCIQAQSCHTNKCPTGVATQNRWLMRGLDPGLKSVRVGNYITVLRKEILRLSRACGVPHPSMVTSEHLEIIDDRFKGKSITALFDYEPDWTSPSKEDLETIRALMAAPSVIPKPLEAPKINDTPAVEHR
jgi:glutamate synthase domain-containing protein 2